MSSPKGLDSLLPFDLGTWGPSRVRRERAKPTTTAVNFVYRASREPFAKFTAVDAMGRWRNTGHENGGPQAGGRIFMAVLP